MSKSHTSVGRGKDGEYVIYVNGQLRGKYATAEDMQVHLASMLPGSQCENDGHAIDNQGVCHRCGYDPASMRQLIERRIIDGWAKGLDEMTNVGVANGWASFSCDRDLVTNGEWRLTPGVVDDHLVACVKACSDEGLLEWLTAQHCLAFR